MDEELALGSGNYVEGIRALIDSLDALIGGIPAICLHCFSGRVYGKRDIRLASAGFIGILGNAPGV